MIDILGPLLIPRSQSPSRSAHSPGTDNHAAAKNHLIVGICNIDAGHGLGPHIISQKQAVHNALNPIQHHRRHGRQHISSKEPGKGGC